MLEGIYLVASQLVNSAKLNYPYFANWIGLLGIIQVMNFCLGRRLCCLGIYPRAWYGLPGIVFTPFIHVGFGHFWF